MSAGDDVGKNDLRVLGFAEALEAARSLGRLRTGSPSLDNLLEGGFQEGKITELFGPSNSGKTQLAIQATVMAAARGWKSVYVDTESTFRPERMVEIAESRKMDADATLKRVFSIRAEDVEGQTRILRRMTEDPRVSDAKLVVVDTVTKNFSLEFAGRERTGKRQGALGSYLNRIALDAYLHRRVVILTNRVASITRNGVSQDINVGGVTVERFVSKSIRLRRRGDIVEASLEMPRNGARPVVCRISEKGFE